MPRLENLRNIAEKIRISDSYHTLIDETGEQDLSHAESVYAKSVKKTNKVNLKKDL